MAVNKKRTEDEMLAWVKKGMVMFMVAMKNQGLYPPTSKLRQETMDRIMDWMGEFLAEEGNLCLTVRKNSLLYRDEVVHLDRPGEQALIFPLFRDGVKWIEFQEGLTRHELDKFFGLMNLFRSLKEEPEDDLVTAMWEVDFSHLKYKSADDFWNDDGELEIVDLPVCDILADPNHPEQAPSGSGLAARPLAELFDPALAGTSGQQDNQIALGLAPPPTNVLERDFSGVSWVLSQEERDYIRAIIDLDQHRYTIYDSLEIILVLLRGIEREQDIVPLLDFMTESVKSLLAEGKVTQTREYLQRLQALTGAGKPWLNTLSAAFNKKLSTEEVGNLMLPSVPMDQPTMAAYGHDLYQLLLVMDPEIIYGLVPQLAKSIDPYLVKVFLTVIAVKASQVGPNPTIPVANALGKIRPDLLVELIGLIETHNLPWPKGFLEVLGRHELVHIREKAASIQAGQAAGAGDLSQLVRRIEAGQADIGQLISSNLTKHRNPEAEKLICDYLGQLMAKEEASDERHLWNCYRALGSCGTAKVVPFLQNILLKGGWKGVLAQGADPHRQGAALALMLLPADWGSRDILRKASKSTFKAIRQACQAAESELRGIDNA